MTSPPKYYAAAIKSVFFTVLILCAFACSNNDDPVSPTEDGEAYWKISSTVKSVSGSSAIILSGKTGTEWHAEVTEGTEWCSFSSKDYNITTKSGQIADGLNVLYVYYKTNSGKTQRRAQLTLRFAENAQKTFDLVQLAESQENLPAFNSWAELPTKVENTNYQYVTHYGLLNNQTIRNYSICFDKTKKAALWVAYPIHDAYLRKNVERTNRWAFDPIVPQSFQANCVEHSYKGSYDRGHQIASADRVCTDEMNAQTFYMSNMNVPVPTNYFKVLLRTKSGSTNKKVQDCSPNELISIGFWVEQKGYGNSIPKSICTTVADIEEKTGFTFFPKVDSSVKQQMDLAQWGIK